MVVDGLTKRSVSPCSIIGVDGRPVTIGGMSAMDGRCNVPVAAAVSGQSFRSRFRVKYLAVPSRTQGTFSRDVPLILLLLRIVTVLSQTKPFATAPVAETLLQQAPPPPVNPEYAG